MESFRIRSAYPVFRSYLEGVSRRADRAMPQIGSRTLPILAQSEYGLRSGKVNSRLLTYAAIAAGTFFATNYLVDNYIPTNVNEFIINNLGWILGGATLGLFSLVSSIRKNASLIHQKDWLGKESEAQKRNISLRMGQIGELNTSVAGLTSAAAEMDQVLQERNLRFAEEILNITGGNPNHALISDGSLQRSISWFFVTDPLKEGESLGKSLYTRITDHDPLAFIEALYGENKASWGYTDENIDWRREKKSMLISQGDAVKCGQYDVAGLEKVLDFAIRAQQEESDIDTSNRIEALSSRIAALKEEHVYSMQFLPNQRKTVLAACVQLGISTEDIEKTSPRARKPHLIPRVVMNEAQINLLREMRLAGVEIELMPEPTEAEGGD